MDLIESQPGRGAPRKSTQPKLPSPPPLSLPSRPDPADPERKQEPKGKDVAETGRFHAEHKDESQRATKQQKIG